MVLVYPLESITIVCSEDVVPPLEDIYLIPPAFKEQVNLKTSLEFFWGLKKNDLNIEIETPLNKMKVRTDLGHLLQESKCILFPSKDIQQLIYEWIPNSGSAALDQKPLYTKVFPPGRYRYSLFPLTFEGDLYSRHFDQAGNATYKRLNFDSEHPILVESAAHPFFLLHFSLYPLWKVPDLYDTISLGEYLRGYQSFMVWMLPAPAEFCIGPDVWREHRYPGSENGSCVRQQLSRIKKPRPSPLYSAEKRKKQQARSYKDVIADVRPLNEINVRLLQMQIGRQLRMMNQQPIPDLSTSVFRWLRDVVVNEPPVEDVEDDECYDSIDSSEEEVVRHIDDALRYSAQLPSILAPGGSTLDSAYFTSTHWAWRTFKIHL